MDYTIKQLSKLTGNTLCERHLRRRCKELQSKFPDFIRRTSNRKWIVSEQAVSELIKRKNGRTLDSQIINSKKVFSGSEYDTLKSTLNQIRQRYDGVEWMYFAGFRPKYKYEVEILFSVVQNLINELNKRTKSNVSMFYAIEKDDMDVYHVHMAIKGSSEIEKHFLNTFKYKFNRLTVKPMIDEFNSNYHDECYKYLSKEYFVDDKMRVGLLIK